MKKLIKLLIVAAVLLSLVYYVRGCCGFLELLPVSGLVTDYPLNSPVIPLKK
jgi:hypothetical protein